MSPEEVLEVARVAVRVLILASLPLLLVTLLIGVLVSLLQALTQLQEVTLTFVPKILVAFLFLILTLPFMAEQLSQLMLFLTDKIAGVV